ncbi:MAG: prenyltransferase/squalene oxidase repeat-containing protein [Lentisphaeria bacterium]|nr:prenyltransferase/squalene oxidase repeat-containing protein [Lentisphaeria bacterium]
MVVNVMESFHQKAVAKLLRELEEHGFCEGQLSSSALATALAAFALASGHPSQDLKAVDRACDWLLRHQNADGGWGDSPDSPSNRTTTLIVWAVLRKLGTFTVSARQSTVRWLAKDFGSCEDEQGLFAERGVHGSLSPATPRGRESAHIYLRDRILSDYGTDQTFSIPILTLLALTDALPWRLVPQLPFELAVIPQRLFRWARLPVVSYALPALIAVGLVRHRRYPTRFFPWRWLRHLCVRGVSRRLKRIQPSGGGFLEAAPLTAFVVMSLTGAGEGDSPVAARGLDFLRRNQRLDGSWPIDTHLATWLTSLAVDALSAANVPIPDQTVEKTRRYLLAAQYETAHRFTGADPGGWAWTHLSGGVPDADDTAAALIALRHLTLEQDPPLAVDQAIRHGVRWLLNQQNRDGGMPTFCRGWGRLPFDRSCPDVTAHALKAFDLWRDQLPELRGYIERGMAKAIAFLHETQDMDGSWRPLWFGNQQAADSGNPVYGTAQVLSAIASLSDGGEMAARVGKGCDYLRRAQNPDGGWGGAAGIASSVEETAVVLRALALCGEDRSGARMTVGMAWLETATQGGESFPSSPIGLYFARLWYGEKMYPIIHAAGTVPRGECQRLSR